MTGKIRVVCPHCDKALTFPSSLIGRTGKCPACNNVVPLESPISPKPRSFRAAPLVPTSDKTDTEHSDSKSDRANALRKTNTRIDPAVAGGCIGVVAMLLVMCVGSAFYVKGCINEFKKPSQNQYQYTPSDSEQLIETQKAWNEFLRGDEKNFPTPSR